MKDGKIAGKINIIDLLVIIAVIVAVAGVIFRVATLNDKNTSGTVSFEYVVKVEGVREFTVQGLEKGGEIFSSDDKLVGEIENVTVEPAEYDLITLDGKRKMIERSDRYTAYVTVKANGVMRGGRFCDAVETPLGVGSDYKVASKYVSTNGKVISLKGIE